MVRGTLVGYDGVAVIATPEPYVPCSAIELFGGPWAQTAGSFTAILSDNTNPDLPTTPQGTLLAASALPGLLDIEYHVQPLHSSTSLPYTNRREDAVYDFALSPLAGFDPDEFQVRGFIMARTAWTLPSGAVSGSAQIILHAELEFTLQSAGFPIVGLQMASDKRVNASGGVLGTPTASAGTGRLWDPTGFHATSFSGESGNFVIDRSVSRGTTRLYMNTVLIAEVAMSVPRSAGALGLIVNAADVRAQIITVSVPVVEMEVQLAGVRLCPSGTAP